MIGALLFFILCFGTYLSFYLNKDIFSPAKFYFMSLFLYFLNIFISDYAFEIYFAFTFYLLLGFTLVFLEVKYFKNNQAIKNAFLRAQKPMLLNPGGTISVIWVLSMIPIGVQVYMIAYFGGVQKYLTSMVFRVEQWQGLNVILGFKDLFPVLNLFFLMILVLFNISRKRKWIVIYIIHLCVAVILGLLTGSRSWVLNMFLAGLVMFNYAKISIKLSHLIIPIMFLIPATVILGTFRSNADKLYSGEITQTDQSSLLGQIGQSTTYKYGLNPLTYIYNKEFTDIKYGATYLTTFTNFIPRKIWPDKPQSAGTIITKFHEGFLYTGLSADSPGFIAEAIINFGYVFCYPFVFFFFTIISLYCLSVYQYLFRHMVIIVNQFDIKTFKKLWFDIVLVVYSNQILGSLTFAESTNIFFNLIKDVVFSLVIFAMVFKVARISKPAQ